MSTSPLHADGTVACIGVFDGVHRGHRALLGHARARADDRGLPLVAVTFDPHPLAVVGPAGAPTSLATVAHRSELLLEAGANEVDVLRFDADLAATEPEEFVQRLLVERLAVREVVVGADFRFGRAARGTVATLEEIGAREGFATLAVPLAGAGEQRWSSTLARRLVTDGDMAAAADVLGRPYRLDGVVVHGDHRGRELGFPTANLGWAGDPTIPADGVYAAWVGVQGRQWPAAVSVGTNPQFEGRERRVESFLIDEHGLDLYDLPCTVAFVERLRGQRTFEGIPALIEQMADDVAMARGILAHG
jgi:riboflavin kinase/FMN adenylyltransferase